MYHVTLSNPFHLSTSPVVFPGDRDVSKSDLEKGNDKYKKLSISYHCKISLQNSYIDNLVSNIVKANLGRPPLQLETACNLPLDSIGSWDPPRMHLALDKMQDPPRMHLALDKMQQMDD